MSTRNRAGSVLGLTALMLGLVTATATAAPLNGTGDAARNSGDETAALQSAIQASGARNVIVIIGDGMGDSEITVARNYAEGAAGELTGIDALPLTGQYTTYSIYRDGPYAGLPDYAPESASTGTAWATGTKSYDGAISVDIAGSELDSMLEIAKANGLRTGNVSTAAIQDATPAVQYSSISQRGCQGPAGTTASCASEAIENGGPGSISEQLLDSRPDVTLGGGQSFFDETAAGGTWAGQTLWEQAEDRGFQVVKTAAELAAVENADSPVLGLFTPSHFPTRFQTTTATVGGGDGEARTCQIDPAWEATGLSLGSLTQTAIDLLDDPASDQGFFLQVEGASIDKQDHAANACGQIGETIDLDEAVQSALEFAKADGETLVIVTADHAHTSQIVDSAGPGLSIKLMTADGAPMIVYYGTADEPGSMQHTGAQVRIAAFGPGAANVVGLTDQTDTFFTVTSTLGLNRDLVALSATPAITAPASVAPGAEFEVSVAGLNGDKTATLTLTDATSYRADIIGGTATFTVTAPATEGATTLTVTGNQTGGTASFEVTVTAGATAAPSPTTVTTTPTATATAGVLTVGGGNGPMAMTGAQVTGIVLVALALLGGGLLLVRARRAELAG